MKDPHIQRQRTGWQLICILALTVLFTLGTSSAVAQDGTTPTTGEQRTMIDVIIDGGFIGGVIILLSVAAVGLMIEHAI